MKNIGFESKSKNGYNSMMNLDLITPKNNKLIASTNDGRYQSQAAVYGRSTKNGNTKAGNSNNFS